MTNLTDINVPGPTTIPLTEPFWDAAAEGRFILQLCGGCQQHVFYPREICPHCWSGDLHWVPASGQGTLKSFTIVHRPGHPGWMAVTPYTVGLVALAEGPTMLSHILGDAPQVGQAVGFAPTNIGGRVLPCFRIITSQTTPKGDLA
ncbi:Zn-ribbon domain-containing OB-fold protein [Pseudoruegeria sp. SK021]|uniref:Zn-ribbon domain-containing OB-fold protein n=1 Tax=Pseudoruegeria sp. SK021 TaxID=1933035 RepID=UPI000A21BAFB|nr:OB-fold domain-containing protein [Pseudoruegeria sp. SK021]OSP54770.1 hypothetical protein BV911_10630 [Pseudoruegeria sp. SK021]